MVPEPGAPPEAPGLVDIVIVLFLITSGASDQLCKDVGCVTKICSPPWQMNAPDRFELFLLPDGVPKVKVEPDQRMPNAAMITFEREDHTLGNLLTVQLMQDPRVVYAAYKVEHPLFAKFVMRLQTEEGYPPREALKNACNALIGQLSVLGQKFRTEYGLKAMLGDE